MRTERRIPGHIGPQSIARRGAVTRKIVAIAACQHGVLSLTQLMECGLTASGVRKRVAAGSLFRIHRGVYALGRPDLPAKGRWMAAVLACGPGALLSHASAAALHGIRSSAAARIDVTVRRPYSISRPGLRVHRSPELSATDVTVIEGIPVTSVPRTLLDLATFLSQPQLERACEQAVLEGLFDLNAISELLSRSHGRPGIRNLRAVLARGDLGENVPASGLERRFRDLCEQAGLPAPEINRHLLLGDTFHKVDFVWRAQRVVIEVDGDRYHSTGWQRRRDAERDALLLAHGYAGARVPEEQLAERPAAAVQAARALLAGR
jgi:very-short-patch-repair endonuclease